MTRSARSGRRWRRAVLLLVVVALLLGVAGWGVVSVGHWLVVADPLERAHAIVVLGGHLPFRAMEAAALYQQGWAPQIWLIPNPSQPEDLVLAKLDIEFIREPTYNRLVLERLGVPPSAIRLLNRPAINTVQELEATAAELRRTAGRRVILITSKAHSRRVRATFLALFTDLDARVRYAPGDPYNPTGWWRHTREALDVSREVFGLLNVWAGFPVKPDRR